MDVVLFVEVAVVVGILVALWVLGDWSTYRRRALRVGRALNLVDPPETSPSVPPIERVAADARRIRAQIRNAPPGIPMARLRGWEAAYDDVLITACRELGLETRLDALPDGVMRDLERERIERLLDAAGLPLRPSA